jgi:hypothetical protein
MRKDAACGIGEAGAQRPCASRASRKARLQGAGSIHFSSRVDQYCILARIIEA